MAIAMLRAPSMEDVVMNDGGPLSAYQASSCHGVMPPSADRRVWYAPAPVQALPELPAPLSLPPRPSADLPNELLLQILSDPVLSARDLATACLISSRWLQTARLVLYSTQELPVADARLASTLWNCADLRALARRVHVEALAGTDGANTVGWMCLPDATPRELTVTGRCPAVAQRIHPALISPGCAPALAHVRWLSVTLEHPPMCLDMVTKLEELTLVGDVNLLKLHLDRYVPSSTAGTLRSLTLRVDECPEWLSTIPVRLARFTALRRFEFICSSDAAEDLPGWPFCELPRTLEVLVLSVCLLPKPKSKSTVPWPARPLVLQLVPCGLLTRAAARTLARVRTLRVSCDEECACDDGARDLLLPVA